MDHSLYTPILKGKLNDIVAFGNLPISMSSGVIPLFELPAFQPTKSKAKTIVDFARNVARYSLNRLCYVDLPLLPVNDKMPDQRITLEYVFEVLNGFNINFIPCFGLSRDDNLWPIVLQRAQLSNGLLIRLERDDLLLPDATIDEIVDLITEKIRPTQLSLLCDWKSLSSKTDAFHCAESTYTFVAKLSKQVIPSNIIVAGSSALKHVTDVPVHGLLEVERYELDLFAEIGFELFGVKITYGDYGVIHPDFSDAILVSHANAKIRYTVGRVIRYERGESLRKGFKFAQYRLLSKRIVNSGKFSGAENSVADKFIAQCAEGITTTGSLGTWVKIDQSRHIHTTTKQIKRLVEIKAGELGPNAILESFSVLE